MHGLLKFGLDELLFWQLIQGGCRLNVLNKSVSDWRIAQGDSLPRRDLFAALLEARDPQTGQGFSHEEIVAEAGLLIIADSDTTITAITATVVYLLHYSSTLRRPQHEIRSTVCDVEDIRIGKQLTSRNYLTAYIDETMRLSRSVGSLLSREILDGGLRVDDEWFPPGVDIGVPHYTFHHNEAIFVTRLSVNQSVGFLISLCPITEV